MGKERGSSASISYKSLGTEPQWPLFHHAPILEPTVGTRDILIEPGSLVLGAQGLGGQGGENQTSP